MVELRQESRIEFTYRLMWLSYSLAKSGSAKVLQIIQQHVLRGGRMEPWTGIPAFVSGSNWTAANSRKANSKAASYSIVATGNGKPGSLARMRSTEKAMKRVMNWPVVNYQGESRHSFFLKRAFERPSRNTRKEPHPWVIGEPSSLGGSPMGIHEPVTLVH